MTEARAPGFLFNLIESCLGNPGDRKSLGHGLYEMRIHYGPGYRVYYGGQGSHLVLLLSGRITGIVLMTRSKSYQEYLIAALADPLEAADYLNVALEDGDKELFLLALRNVAEARLGGISQLATATGLNRENLYRMLSGKGNPELKSLDRLLRALGLKLAVEADSDAA